MTETNFASLPGVRVNELIDGVLAGRNLVEAKATRGVGFLHQIKRQPRGSRRVTGGLKSDVHGLSSGRGPADVKHSLNGTPCLQLDNQVGSRLWRQGRVS